MVNERAKSLARAGSRVHRENIAKTRQHNSTQTGESRLHGLRAEPCGCLYTLGTRQIRKAAANGTECRNCSEYSVTARQAGTVW